MKAEIITSGTELLLGEITDTNTPYVSRKLADIGINVYHHTTVGDNGERLLEAIRLAASRADIVIVSGGLGPTQDDITKDVLAEYLDVKLMVDENSLEKIAARYHTDQISDENYHQAMILEGSLPLRNDVGMAAGIFMEVMGQFFVLLPGPPNEFEPMVSNYLLPKLSDIISEKFMLRSRNLNFYGLPEASIAQKLYDLIKNQSNPTIAIYAKEGYIDIRLTARAATEAGCNDLLDQAEEQVLAVLVPYFFSYGEVNLSELIFEELAGLGETISLVEVQTKGEILEEWSKELKQNKILKGGLYFTDINEVNNFYQANVNEFGVVTTNFEGTNEKILRADNDRLAEITRQAFQSDYGVSVTSWGVDRQSENNLPERMFISIAQVNGQKATKVMDFSHKTYYTRSVISLAVSDFVRRYLLNLPELGEL